MEIVPFVGKLPGLPGNSSQTDKQLTRAPGKTLKFIILPQEDIRYITCLRNTMHSLLSE